jgi:hypothetical protein
MTRYPQSIRVFLGTVDNMEELTSYLEAKDQPIWNAAMSEELKALKKNSTWTLVPLPKGKKMCRI